MKININDKNIVRRVTPEHDVCSLCYFTKCNIDCFEPIYSTLHGCFINASYYDESNTDDNLFKL